MKTNEINLKKLQKFILKLENYEAFLLDLYEKEALTDSEILGITFSKNFWYSKEKHYSKGGINPFEVQKMLQEFKMFLEQSLQIFLTSIDYNNIKQIRKTMLLVYNDILICYNEYNK